MLTLPVFAVVVCRCRMEGPSFSRPAVIPDQPSRLLEWPSFSRPAVIPDQPSRLLEGPSFSLPAVIPDQPSAPFGGAEL
ncbi:MAG: hypothetical protein ABFE07_07760 [Armatimonadia bacterium]